MESWDCDQGEYSFFDFFDDVETQLKQNNGILDGW